MSLARRKLSDRVMEGFIVGNTIARSLVTENEAKAFAQDTSYMKLLYCGVGDVRNVLLTLKNSQDVNAKVHINDLSPATLARNIVLLYMVATSKENYAHAIAVWIDTLLSAEAYESFTDVLKKLLNNSKEYPKWLKIPDERTKQELRKHWREWLNASYSKDMVEKERKKAMSARNVGHGRVKPSADWIKNGISTKGKQNRSELKLGNPTLFRGSKKNGTFCFAERQSAAGAFTGLDQYAIGSKEFAKELFRAWFPLFRSFRRRVKGICGEIEISVWLGDCTVLLHEKKLGGDFHAIDTSNLMDYLGMWNLLICGLPCLSRTHSGTFIQTENILGLADGIENLLMEELPHSSAAHEFLMDIFGVIPKPIPAELTLNDAKSGEKVVRTRWVLQNNDPGNTEHTEQKEEKMKTEKQLKKKMLIREIKSLLPSDIEYEKEKMNSELQYMWGRELEMLRDGFNHVNQLKMDPDCDPDELQFCLEEVFNSYTQIVEEGKKKRNSNSKLDEDEEEMNDFQSQLYEIMEMMMVAKPMTPEMLSHIHNPVLKSYAWPKSTTATFSELLARGKVSSKNFRKFSKGCLTNYFGTKAMGSYPHMRNRSLALRCECALRQNRLDGLINLGSKEKFFYGSQTPKVYYTQLESLQDLSEKKAGIFEPALAAVLVRTDSLLHSMQRVSGKWMRGDEEEDADEDETEVNLMYSWLGKRNGANVQVIDNVAFDLDTNIVGLLLPSPEDKESIRIDECVHFPIVNYKYMVLIDVQKYEILTKPVHVSQFYKERPESSVSCTISTDSIKRLESKKRKRKRGSNK